MTANTSRRFALIEALTFTAFVSWYIWQLQASFFYSWIVFPVWMIASFLRNGDTFRSIGWHPGNLWSATKLSAMVLLPCVFAVGAAGLILGGWHRPLDAVFFPRHFFGYMSFCLVQQMGLNSMVNNRLLSATQSIAHASLISGLLFAFLHWPNPVLVPLTGIGGALMAWVFAKERNILVLTVWQGILGTLVWWAFPLAWHHAMRVGPGFYHFHPK